MLSSPLISHLNLISRRLVRNNSIKGSPGEVTDVGIFSDNADKTVFEVT